MSVPPGVQARRPERAGGGAPALRLNVLSDLHLSQGDLAWPRTRADVVVLAGDIARPPRGLEWALGFQVPVVYVAGNHEFYGSSLPATMDALKRLAGGSGVHVLDRDEWIFRGVRFLGATLWTDFMLDGGGAQRERAMHEAAKCLRDFSRIQSGDDAGKCFTPEESTRMFTRDRDWLAGKLSARFAGPTVVVTHHAPSRQSIATRFAGSPLNGGFISGLEAMMGAERVALWIHGHTHDSFDYRVRGTRVVCNPRGYARDGINENAEFDPGLLVEVEPG